MRIKAVIAYDGGRFHGFQRQKHTDQTVVSILEKACKNIQIESPVVGSGRTDAGVHATGQVIHLDLPEFWHDLTKLRHILNHQLSYIKIKQITPVADTFHARFSAKRRCYRYLFTTSRPSVFSQDYLAYVPSIDLDLLGQALACFVGKHDFGYFHKSGSDTHTTIRHLYRAEHRWLKGNYHAIYFEADGFLRAQVRMMTEAAMRFACSQTSLESLKAQLAKEEKNMTGLAPAGGLYLARIVY
jgi:tRNA pseudouridine38-40 synthase